MQINQVKTATYEAEKAAYLSQLKICSVSI